MREVNPRLIGKDMNELHEMFPDAKMCTSPTCEWTSLDHAIVMEYEQHNINMAKKGMIRVMYRMNYPDPDTKIFEWWNGEKWVTLTQ